MAQHPRHGHRQGWMSRAEDQRSLDRTGRDVPSRRQAFGLRRVEVDDQFQRRAPVDGPRAQRPMPRLSIRSVAVSGRSRNGTAARLLAGSIRIPSSAIKSAPSAISSSASVDFPLPEAPQISTPMPSRATALAWMWMRWGSGRRPIGSAGRGRRRHAGLRSAGRRRSARPAVRTRCRDRSGGCSRPRSRRHGPPRSAWRSRGRGRNGCRTASPGVRNRSG
jgi:hypothetical protein